MKLTCPSCHTIFHLESAMEEAAGREFMVYLAGLGELARPMVAYLGLFRPATRALAYERMLRLAREVMELSSDNKTLATALSETVEALRAKREQGGGKKLTNHNYLKKVIESQIPPGPPSLKGGAFGEEIDPTLRKGGDRQVGGISRRGAALSILSEWAGDDWLRREVSAGLQALIAQSLKGAPACDVIAKNADIWHVALVRSCTIEEVDAPRIRAGFERLFASVKEWPAPKQLLELMPSRPARVSLPAPEPTEEDRQKGREAIRQFKEKFGIS